MKFQSTSKFIFLFISLFLLIKFSNSSLIFENIPKSLIQEGFKNELKKIQEHKSMSKLDLGSFTFTDEVLGTVVISQLKQEIQYLELNKMTLTLEDNLNQILTGKDGTLKLQYSFVYNISPDIQDKGSFNLESTTFTVTKSFTMTSDKILKHNGILSTLEFIPNNILYEGDTNLKNLIDAAIGSLPTWVTPKLIVAYQQDFSDYYSNNTGGNHTFISFQTKSPQLDCTVDLTRDKLPHKLNDNSILYYLSGRLNDHQDVNKEPLFDQDLVYQVFLDKELFNNLLTDLTKEGLLDFTLNKSSRPDASPFYLDIQSLGQIIPELYDLYPREKEIYVYSKITNFEIFQNKMLGGYLNMRTSIYIMDDVSEIFEYETKFSFEINHSLSVDKINLFVDQTGFGIVDLKLIKSNYKEVDKNTLTVWTEETLKTALSEKFFLFKAPLDLGNYFKEISEVKCNQNGCLLKGVGRVTNYVNIEKLQQSGLKFLNYLE